jgi:hypothetical protein
MLLSFLWISWKLAEGRPYFSCGREWNCMYACCVQPCGIMKVKNSLCALRHGPQQKLHSCQRDVHIYSNATRLPSAQSPNHYSTLPSVCILYWPRYTRTSLHYEVKRLWNFIRRTRIVDAILKYLPVMADNVKLSLKEIGCADVGRIHMAEDQKHCWGPSEHCNKILSCIKRGEICMISEWRIASCSRLVST